MTMDTFGPADFGGTYENESITLRLTASGDAYSGTLEVGGEEYSVAAKSNGGAGLVGSYQADGTSHPLSANLSGSRLSLSSEGNTYSLTKAPSGMGTLAQSATKAPPKVVNLDMPYRHESGLGFNHPSSWKRHPTQTGMTLVPDDAENNEQGQPLEVFIFAGEDAPGIDSPSDPQIAAYFDREYATTLPGLKRRSETGSLGTLLGPAAVYTYEGKSQEGLDLIHKVYVSMYQGQGIYLIHMSRSDLHERLERAAQQMFASLNFVQPANSGGSQSSGGYNGLPAHSESQGQVHARWRREDIQYEQERYDNVQDQINYNSSVDNNIQDQIDYNSSTDTGGYNY